MSDKRVKVANQIGPAPKNPREDRLKQALRENLKRRKSQSRGRSELAVTVTDDDGPPDEKSPAKNRDAV